MGQRNRVKSPEINSRIWSVAGPQQTNTLLHSKMKASNKKTTYGKGENIYKSYIQ